MCTVPAARDPATVVGEKVCFLLLVLRSGEQARLSQIQMKRWVGCPRKRCEQVARLTLLLLAACRRPSAKRHHECEHPGYVHLLSVDPPRGEVRSTACD
jgi:hypothetical protein